MKKKLMQFFDSLLFAFRRSTEYSLPNMSLVSATGAVGFPLFYVIWRYLFPQPYENLGLRLLGSAIFFPLIFHARWLPRWRPYLPYYWAFSMLYGACFFFSFMLLKNNLNQVWTLSAMAGAVLLVFVSYDWRMMTLFYLAGLLLAGLASFLTGSLTFTHCRNYAQQIPVYFFVLFFGALFTQTKERILREKQATVSRIGGMIAHEIRTPLISIRGAAAGLKRYLPILMQAYDAAKTNGIPVQKISSKKCTLLETVPESIDREVKHANTVIDMLLLNSKRDYLHIDHFERCSIRECVESTLADYPFKSAEEKRKVSFDGSDFCLLGDTAYLKNVLFNLLNNALYFIADAGKGCVEISAVQTEGSRYNHLYFKDTGAGIDPAELPRLFTPFYTKGRNGGSGIGLSFCKQVMRAFGGNITCQSEHGKYTLFTLSFPKIGDFDES